MRDGTYPAIATHDPAMIDATREFATTHGIGEGSTSSSRCCTASGAICRRRWSRTAIAFRVYVPFGTRVVPLLHAPAGRAPGQRRLRAARRAERRLAPGRPDSRHIDQHVAAREHVVHDHVLLGRVQTRAARPEEHRRRCRRRRAPPRPSRTTCRSGAPFLPCRSSAARTVDGSACTASTPCAGRNVTSRASASNSGSARRQPSRIACTSARTQRAVLAGRRSGAPSAGRSDPDSC